MLNPANAGLDPRVKPEDDNLNCLFLYVIPAGRKRESIQYYVHFNLFTNEPFLILPFVKVSPADPLPTGDLLH